MVESVLLKKMISGRGEATINRIFVFSLFCLIYSNALAVSWHIEPVATLKGSYTDNVTLESNDLAESDFITEILPGIHILGDGNRLDLDFNYRLQHIRYLDHAEANKTQHTLGLAANISVVEDLFFIDVRSDFTQRPVFSDSVRDPENIAITDDVTDVFMTSISPYLNHRFGNFAVGRLMYTAQRVKYADSATSDVDHRILDGSLASGTRFTNFRWNLTYLDRKEEPEAGIATRFKIGMADMRYTLYKSVFAIAKLGYEKNTYSVPSDSDETEGEVWGLGLGWAPTTRTSMEAVFGKRYFGNTANVIVIHEGSLFTVSALYDEDFTTGSFVDGGSPSFDEDGRPVYGIDRPSISTEVYLNKRLSADLVLELRKSEVTFTIFDTKREYQTRGSTEHVYGGDVVWDWTLSSRTTATFGAFWHQTAPFDDVPRVDDFYGGVRFERRFSPHLTGGADYSFTKRDSVLEEENYNRNRVGAFVTYEF
ncbi:MAG: TIGR03016 family PEP-CTERM system-associated outer membrane protein [Gammaproteobacteria bacterium (ex Lamellibrachia satsuma)]|nr:MAG: TIGR03016 family PEP-CTERM system-associated outer membrane protein [Gammaproteobacteria bacterium (ex Lamellibrachia satsuma)]